MIEKIKNITKKLNLFNKTEEKNQSPKEWLIIESISACQVRCVWCSPQIFKKHSIGYMSAVKFEEIISKNIDFIKETYSVISPYSRGEPLLHPEFWQICEILKKYDLFDSGVQIHSNLSVEVDVDEFKKYPLQIVVNFGGITKDVHEKVMRRSQFDLVVKNFKGLVDNNIDVIAKITPTKDNIHQINEFSSFINKISGKDVPTVIGTTGIMIPYGLSNQEKDIYFAEVVSPEVDDYLRFTYDLDKANKNIIPKDPKCPYLIDTIYFDGRFTICCHDKEPLINCGNVFKTSIKKIRQSSKYKKYRELGKQCKLKICKGCN